ncbi:MAG TPA: M4 family metallopeptidase, partial [Ignavibacteria bacterium]|nr:M4 family metallopeptidase [Ignavibacteria bacterium]
DITKSMYGAGISPGDETYGNIITKSSLTNSVVTSNSTIFSDPAAVDAHTYTSEFYDFVKNNFDRTSWDGNGRSIISNVHYGSNYNNAFWSNYYEQLYYGDSDGKNFVSFAASKDIVAHEITHGITYSTSGLIYFDQPGALNESFSDIMGVAFDNDDWLIGEDHTIAEPKYTRNFINPNLGYITFPLSFGAQPNHMSQYFYAPYDNGGIHYNSGIHNKAMYTLSEFIGREDAAKIFYKTFTTYLSANSHFIDARFAAIRSAKDLNLDTTAVKTAYDAVGIFPFSKDASEIYIYDPIVETDVSIFATLPMLTTASADEKFSLHISPSITPMHLMTIAFIYGAGQQNREVNIEIYEDESGTPGDKLGDIQYSIPLNDAFAAIVDLSFLGIDVWNDFHVVLASPSPGFKVAFISDQNNNRSLLYNGNQWELLYGSIGIRAVTRYQRDASLEVRWAKQKLNTAQAIRSFSMFSTETGWVVGTYGTLLFTYTGGLIWHDMGFEGGEDLLSIDFADVYTGCLIGGVNIYYTTDGGLEWKTAENPSYNNMKAVQLVTNNIGWAVGNWGTILKTTDGGATWLQQSTQTGSHFYALDFVDENTGCVVGANGVIYYTTDGGDNWVEQTSPASNYFYGVDFIDADLGWIVGGEGVILKTTDGGKNWIKQSAPVVAGLRSVDAIDDKTVYAVGFGGTLIKTLDGNPWQVEPTGEVNNFYCIQFADYNTGWIGGELGTILNTRPQITDVNIIGEKPLKWELQQNYPNPFNPNTTIKFAVPERSIVSVEVFNILGQRIALLLDETKEPGSHQVEWRTKGLASGVYIYTLRAKTVDGRNNFRTFKKMILLK